LPSPHGDPFGNEDDVEHSQATSLHLYTNAAIWAGDSMAQRPQAFVVDASTGRIAFVGALASAPSAGRVIDLHGAHVVPGLVDSHVHLIPGGLSLSRLDLSSIASKQQLVQAVAAAAARLPVGSWLLGGGWDESHWGGELPSAAWIDAGVPKGSGHACLEACAA
jgi:hypothetical protein